MNLIRQALLARRHATHAGGAQSRMPAARRDKPRPTHAGHAR